MFNHLLFVNTFAARSLPLTPCRLSFWRRNRENTALPPSCPGAVAAEPRARGTARSVPRGPQPGCSGTLGAMGQGTGQGTGLHQETLLGDQRAQSVGYRTGNADRSRGEAWRGSWPSSLPPRPRTPTLHSPCRRDPTHTRITKSPKSLQAWNSPICLLEQQLSHESKHPKLLNVRLQFLALALALVTLLRLLSEPRPPALFLCQFSPLAG